MRKLMHLMPSIILSNSTPREEFQNIYPDMDELVKKDDVFVVETKIVDKTIMTPKEYGLKKMKPIIIR